MQYFSKDFFKFFKELSNNNNTDWFHANKAIYEEQIKNPFKSLVDEMILRIHGEEPDLNIEAKDAIFRINRDIRFSKDKTPYKTFVSANIQRGGKKSTDSPGFYFHFALDKAFIGGGAHHADKEGVYKIRSRIADSSDEFSRLIKDKKFKEKFGEILGEKNKRIPPEYKEAEIKEPLIANKNFFFMAELDPKVILKTNLPDILMTYYHAGAGVNQFLKKALSS
jgi:uncharacterized protein (TIGR02453 family)